MKRKRKIPGHHKIGYGRPPDSYKYKKGQCGNLEGGRLHKSRLTSLTDEIDKLESELIPILYGGKRKKVTTTEAMFRQLMNKAMQGHLAAGKQLLKLVIKYSPPEDPPPQEFAWMIERPRGSGKLVRVR
jgi:hypothetical protein